ncbi:MULTISPECIES: D-2-hydroxyacid dehydrogenase [Arthrobacter]|uniref:D-2-hydroxyacid dehydrogenase n=1 Tax=Arthrobacter ramosus TaxID=1672 RepID=A0ABV5XT55_ARTRM|nr:D-2-hydroxyacid dehydrogenase [Arthrobacter ramosus]
MIRVVVDPGCPTGVPETVKGLRGLDVVLAPDRDAVAAELAAGAEVLVTSYWRDDFLTPSLRWVAGNGAGTDQYPLEDFSRNGIELTTAHGVHASCVAEHAFALLLGVTRGIGQSVRNSEAHRWSPMTVDELCGKKMAIIGLGRIGEEVARRAIAWGMEVAGLKRTPETYKGCVPVVRGPGALHELCSWADILMITAPATNETRGLIGAEEFALLGAGWLVNVGRGPLVDSDALLVALRDGELRGAGIDVTDPEPLPQDSPLWDCPDLIITPHIGGDSPNFAPRWAQIFEHNLVAYAGLADWRNRLEHAASEVSA